MASTEQYSEYNITVFGIDTILWITPPRLHIVCNEKKNAVQVSDRFEYIYVKKNKRMELEIPIDVFPIWIPIREK